MTRVPRLTLLTALAAAAFSAGCSKSVSYTVAGETLTVQDTGYYSTSDSAYCEAAGVGQLKIAIVDYFPICGSGSITPDGGLASATLEHNELDLIFVTTGHTDSKKPYDVSTPDCTLGPAGPAMAFFYHYPAETATPTMTVAQGGEMYLTSYDATGKDPAKGSFTLDFGSSGMLSGSFSTYTCN